MIDLVLFRARIGLFNRTCHRANISNIRSNNHNVREQVMYAGNVYDIVWCIFLLIYTYILCLIMALVVDISRSDAFGSAHITQSFLSKLS